MHSTNREASSFVLANSEFLTSILSLLDIRDLLVSAQRVNRCWNKVVTTSDDLQEALFLKSSAGSSNTPRTLNPLLRAIWPPWFMATSSFSREHPRPTVAAFQQLEWAQRPAVFQRRDASWRKMLLVSGRVEGITALKITLQNYGWNGTEQSERILEYTDGVRMGTLWDITMDWCREKENVTFMMNWGEALTLDAKERVKRVVEERMSTHMMGWQLKNKFYKIFRKKELGQNSTDEKALSSAPEENPFLELILTSFRTCQPHEDMGVVLGVGSEFQSEDYEKVTIPILYQGLASTSTI